MQAVLSRGPPRLTLGARATAPAWSFGHEWAKQNCISINSAIPGVYVGKRKRNHFFLWDGDDAPCQAHKMSIVKWTNDLDADDFEAARDAYCDAALHLAKQALFLMRNEVAHVLVKGTTGLDTTLRRVIRLRVDTLAQMEMAFSSLSECSKTTIELLDRPVETYDGAKEASRKTMTVAFHTLKKVRDRNPCFTNC